MAGRRVHDEVLISMDGGEVRVSASHGHVRGISMAIVLPEERPIEQRRVNGCHIELSRLQAAALHTHLGRVLKMPDAAT